MSKEEKRAEMLSMIADWQQSGKSKKNTTKKRGSPRPHFIIGYLVVKKKIPPMEVL